MIRGSLIAGAVLVVLSSFLCNQIDENDDWLRYTFSDAAYSYEVRYPSTWIVSERNRVREFFPPGEDELPIQLLVYDTEGITPLAVHVTYDTLRVLERNGEEISVVERDPASVLEHYVAFIRFDTHVAEFRMLADRKYDSVFDHMILSFRHAAN